MASSTRWKFPVLFLLAFIFSPPIQAESNPLFFYTHRMSSPYTMPAGRLYLGTSVGVGVTDFLQISTDVVRDIYKTYNVQAKLSVLDSSAFAVALTGGYVTYNYADAAVGNPNLQINTVQPGGVIAIGLAPTLAWFVGGHVDITNTQLITSGITTSGFFSGTTLESDLSWAYSPEKKHLGNVLSVGVTYDTSYRIYGVGMSHHWPGFHVGLHYYPNAAINKLDPIISGGAAVNL
ncbi:hypothetical protein K2X30_05190 [bacterium]|jgi:hypothetical protein|nr:hypothetical protein [bacterium]